MSCYSRQMNLQIWISFHPPKRKHDQSTETVKLSILAEGGDLIQWSEKTCPHLTHKLLSLLSCLLSFPFTPSPSLSGEIFHPIKGKKKSFHAFLQYLKLTRSSTPRYTVCWRNEEMNDMLDGSAGSDKRGRDLNPRIKERCISSYFKKTIAGLGVISY